MVELFCVSITLNLVKGKVCLYGSFLTNLHDSFSTNNCFDLNLYIDFSKEYLESNSLGEIYFNFIKEIKNCNVFFNIRKIFI